MAYRQPAFMFDSVITTTLANITARNASALSDASKRALFDQRPSPFASIVATGANAGVQFDSGLIFAKPWTRAIIPPGHNLAGETVRVISDTTAGMATPDVKDSMTAPQATLPLDFEFSAGTTDRYWGFEVTTSSAETFLVGEFAVGIYSQLSASAAVNPGWTQAYQDETATQRFAGRDAVLVLAPQRRVFTLRVADVIAGSADSVILENVAKLGRDRPFWYWPTDDTIGPFQVLLTQSARVAQDFPAPLVSVRFAYEFSMLEQLA
jgi:hypothetical protein